MSVSIQLPGYRPAQAGAVADIMNAVNNMRTGSATRGNLEQEAKGKELANQKTEMETNAAKTQMMQLNAPDSPATKMIKGEGLLMLKNIGTSGLVGQDQESQDSFKGLSAVLTAPETTGLQVNSYFSSSPMVKDFHDLQKAKLTGIPAATRAGAQADSDARGVATTYHSSMANYKGVNDDIRKIESVLKQKDKAGNPLITSQAMKEANFAFNRIMSPGHMSDAGLKETEYGSASEEFAAALQRLTSDPKDTGARKLVEHMVDGAHRVGNVSNQNALRALEAIDAGNSSLTLPAAQQTARGTSAQYKKMFSNMYPEIGGSVSHDHAIGTTKAFNGTNYTFKGGDWSDKKNWSPAKTAGTR